MKKKIIIFIILLILVAIALGVIYFTTDILKPKDQMFQKFLIQGIEQIDQTVDISAKEEYTNMMTNNDYNDEAEITFNYANNQNIAEKYNAKISGITSNTNNTSYRNIKINYGENNIEVLNLEFLKENEIYGLIFSDVVNKFISIDNNNLDGLLGKLNINKEELENQVNSKKQLIERFNITEEEKENIKKEYTNILKQVSSKQYSFQDNQMITLSNAKSITAKAYTLTLTNAQTKELYINILKGLGEVELRQQIEDKDEISNLITTLYVEEEKIVRIAIEFENQKINIDLYDNNINIKYDKTTENEIQTRKISIQKQDNNYIIEYEDYNNTNLSVNCNIVKSQTGVNLVSKIKYNSHNVKGIDINIRQNIKINPDAKIDKTFNNTGNVLLNNYDTDTVNAAISSLWNLIDKHLEKVQQEAQSELLGNILEYNTKIENEAENAQETAKEKFNNQFELYQGENIEAEVVLNMLDVAGKNMTSYQSIGQEKIEIYIKQDHENSNMSEKIKKQIQEKGSTYNISFKYDESGKINTITIEDYVEEKTE